MTDPVGDRMTAEEFYLTQAEKDAIDIADVDEEARQQICKFAEAYAGYKSSGEPGIRPDSEQAAGTPLQDSTVGDRKVFEEWAKSIGWKVEPEPEDDP